MARSKHDALYIICGTVLGSISTLLLYSGIKNFEAKLDTDDVIVAGLGSALLGLLPEILRLLSDNERPQFKEISELLQQIKDSGLKIGTLVSLMPEVFSLWSEFAVGTRAVIGVSLTAMDTFLSHLQKNNSLKGKKARYFLNGLVAAFSSFMSSVVVSKMYEEVRSFDINLSNNIKIVVITIVASMAGISNLLPIKKHVEDLNADNTSIAMKMYHRISAFLTYIAGQSVWLGFMAALIQMKLIKQFYPKTDLRFDDAMGLFIVDSLALSPYFEALMREHNRRDSHKEIGALNLLVQVLKGAIISLCCVSPGEPIPKALLFSTMGVGAVSYFLPQVKPPGNAAAADLPCRVASSGVVTSSIKTFFTSLTPKGLLALQKLHKAITGLLAEGLDSGVAVSFIRTLFTDLIPKTLTPEIYAALVSSILIDMFVLKPASRREASNRIFQGIRILRNALVAVGFANAAEQVLDKVIESFFGSKLPTSVSVLSISALVLVEVTGDVLAAERMTPTLLAAMRSIIVFFGLLEGWSAAFLALNTEDAPQAFSVTFAVMLLLTSMTFWFSQKDDAFLQDARNWIASPFNSVVELCNTTGYRSIQSS